MPDDLPLSTVFGLMVDKGYLAPQAGGWSEVQLRDAIRRFQGDEGLEVSGNITTQTAQALGIPHAGGWTYDPSTQSYSPDGTGDYPDNRADFTEGDYTTPSDTRFNGLPGNPAVWLNSDTGQMFVVYEVPGIEPPIPLMFEVPNESDWSAFTGDKGKPNPDQTFTQDQLNSFGSIVWGSTDTIPDTEGDPFSGFVARMTRAMEVQPWLEDDEVWATYAGAWLEDRPVEEWELAATDYWQGLNSAERQWISLSASDPQEAARVRETNYTMVSDMFRQVGVEGVPGEVLEFMATKFSHGTWSQAHLQEQVWVMTGSPSSEPLNGDLRAFLQSGEHTVPQAQFMDTDVKGLFDTWLGPAFPPSDNQVKEWAAKMRRSPEQTRDELTEYLRRQRVALFPSYEDDSLTYEDIAAPWRSFQQNMWGQTIDETDPTFLEVVRMNDANEAGKLLRREGLNREIGTVQQSVISGLERQTQRVVNPV